MKKMTYREALELSVIILESEEEDLAQKVLESMLEDVELEPYLDRIALSGTSVSATKPEAGVGREEA